MNSNFNLIDTVCMALVILICFRGVSSLPSGDVSNIAGGEYAKRGEFPYQVSIKSRFFSKKNYTSWDWNFFLQDSHFCGGAIIGPGIVLSAAHCFDNAEEPALSCPNRENVIEGLVLEDRVIYRYHKRYVRAGVINNIDDNEPELQMRDVEYISFHPAYEEGFRFCETHSKIDLAVAFLSSPFYFNRYVRPIPLARDVPQNEVTECVITGWGGHEKNDGRANFLKKLKEIVHKDNISDTITVEHTDVLFAQTACEGDSGGPLVCNGQLMGVAWKMYQFKNVRCPGLNDTYSIVPHHLPWLEELITIDLEE